MKAQTLTILTAVLFAATASAGRISEPGTVFYGRVFSRTIDREFLITAGELKWTINAAPNGQTYELNARLEPLGDGTFSYRVNVPHQLLAYDLAVSSRSVPITTAGLRLRHQKITVNGFTAAIVAPAVDEFTAQQATRAATYRVDLEVQGLSVDSDGDGLPDWWEDQNGLDKWDPRDASRAVIGSGGGATGGDPNASVTFAQWREVHFPGATGNLDAFGQEDPDRDGIPNLLEYAFQLNPWMADDAAARSGFPRGELRDGHFALLFRKHPAATDLVYHIELSESLLSWKSASDETEALELNEEELHQKLVGYRDRNPANSDSPRFLRVRVERVP